MIDILEALVPVLLAIPIRLECAQVGDHVICRVEGVEALAHLPDMTRFPLDTNGEPDDSDVGSHQSVLFWFRDEHGVAGVAAQKCRKRSVAGALFLHHGL